MPTMQFLTHNDQALPTQGMQLQGTIQATRAELQFAFGEPMHDTEVGKVSTEWRLQFADGLIVAIYDWKEPEKPALNETIAWRIGSSSAFAVTRIHMVFRRKLNALQDGHRRRRAA